MASSSPVTMPSKTPASTHGFLSLSPETSIAAAVSTQSSPSLTPVDSTDSLAVTVKNKRSPSTDSASSTSSSSGAARRFLRLGHLQPDETVVKGDFVDVEE
ncbi:hypothetical protein B9Z65_3221 [Elsinoe australis]|uniref:Uncharacterized protein n=1 Tax=Elsinoe australis TaxID=40998 RepID=A0A2P7ZUS0_9PEZI|nr:hypothetical protein B9Z65_3221 [Elsinoe australis]